MSSNKKPSKQKKDSLISKNNIQENASYDELSNNKSINSSLKNNITKQNTNKKSNISGDENLSNNNIIENDSNKNSTNNKNNKKKKLKLKQSKKDLEENNNQSLTKNDKIETPKIETKKQPKPKAIETKVINELPKNNISANLTNIVYKIVFVYNNQDNILKMKPDSKMIDIIKKISKKLKIASDKLKLLYKEKEITEKSHDMLVKNFFNFPINKTRPIIYVKMKQTNPVNLKKNLSEVYEDYFKFNLFKRSYDNKVKIWNYPSMEDIKVGVNDEIHNVVNEFLKEINLTTDYTVERKEENKYKNRTKPLIQNTDTKTKEQFSNLNYENTEEKKNDSDINNNINENVFDNIIDNNEKSNNEINENLSNEIKENLNNEKNDNLNNEMKENVNNETKENVNNEIKDNLNNEMKDNFNNEIKDDLNNNTNDNLNTNENLNNNINDNSNNNINKNNEKKNNTIIAYYIGFPSPDIAFDFNRYMNTLKIMNPTFRNIKIQIMQGKKKSKKKINNLNDENDGKNYKLNYNYRYGTSLNLEEVELEKRNFEILNIVRNNFLNNKMNGLIRGNSYNYLNSSSPYTTPYDERVKDFQENKKKWLSPRGFICYVNKNNGSHV